MRTSLKPGRVVFLPLRLNFVGELKLVHRQTGVWRSLEDGQLACDLCRLLRDLYARRTGPDHGDTLALETQSSLRPERGMVHTAFEGFGTFNLRGVRWRAGGGCEDHIAGRHDLVVVDPQLPNVGLLDVGRRPHSTI